MAQPPQPDEAGILLKVGAYIGTLVVGIIGTVISVLFKRVVDKHDAEIASIKSGIKEVIDKMHSKADKVELDRQRDHVGELFRQSREDKEEILGAIHSLSTTVVTELGKRPTRDEMALFQGKKR